jgi:hypothetical protein
MCEASYARDVEDRGIEKKDRRTISGALMRGGRVHAAAVLLRTILHNSP